MIIPPLPNFRPVQSIEYAQLGCFEDCRSIGLGYKSDYAMNSNLKKTCRFLDYPYKVRIETADFSAEASGAPLPGICSHLCMGLIMSIRAKLFITYIVAIIVAVSSVAVLVVWQINRYAETNFAENAGGQLERIDNVLTLFVENGKSSATYLAAIPAVRNAENQLNNYSATTQDTVQDPVNLTPLAQEVRLELLRIVKSNPAYQIIYLGTNDGGFVQAPDDEPLSAGYNPAKRPWYAEALEAKDDIDVTAPYTSDSGGLVTTVTCKVYDLHNKLAGVIGIDFSLDGLTNYLNALKIGDTGRVIVLDETGMILVDQGNKADLYKNADEAEDPIYKEIQSLDQGDAQLDTDKGVKFVSVYTSPALGWRLAVAIDSEEVHARAMDLTKQIILIGMLIAVLLMLVVIMLINRSIAKPVSALVHASEDIATGNFDALPEARMFTGELRQLYDALGKMVSNLKNMILESKEQAAEARHQTEAARKATEEADRAKHQAEAARREGMLQAAASLEGIVGQVLALTEGLNQRVDLASKGADHQRVLTSQAAEAVGEMGLTIHEVERNSGQAGETAEETRNNALKGRAVVSNLAGAITDVDAKAQSLKESLNKLGDRADSIGQIMTVISDIADQTNLLALNAAIEAARAGEAGRGFAVVADEVRKLAEKTMQATKEVSNAVKAIQDSTQQNINEMEAASQAVGKSTELAHQADDALEFIVRTAESNAALVNEISAVVSRQLAAGEAIKSGTDQVNNIAMDTADSMADAAKEMAELSKVADALRRVVDNLKNS